MEKIRLKLKKSWGNFHAGDEVNFGESKGRPLISRGAATEIPAFDENDVLIPNKIQEKTSNKKIRVKLLRAWGGYITGDKILCDASKGQGIIENNLGVEVPATNKRGEYLPNKIQKRTKSKMLIRLKLLKNWGNFAAGSVLDFGRSKGEPLIDNGTAIKISKREKIVKIAV